MSQYCQSVKNLTNYVLENGKLREDHLWNMMLSGISQSENILTSQVVIDNMPHIPPHLFPTFVDVVRESFLGQRYPNPIALAKGTLKADNYESCCVTGEKVAPVEVSPEFLHKLDDLFERMRMVDFKIGDSVTEEIPLFAKSLAALVDLFFHLGLAVPDLFYYPTDEECESLTECPMPRYMEMALSLPENTQNDCGFWVLWHLLSHVKKDSWDLYSWPHMWDKEVLAYLIPWYAQYLIDNNSDRFGKGIKVCFVEFVLMDEERAELIKQLPREYAEIAACLHNKVRVSAVPQLLKMADEGISEDELRERLETVPSVYDSFSRSLKDIRFIRASKLS